MDKTSGDTLSAIDRSDPINTYRIASAYVMGDRTVSFEPLARVTARCVARWADRYEAWPVGDPSRMRQGPMPLETGQREQLVDDLFDRLEEWLAREWTPAAVGLVGLRLFHNGREILDQHDGIPLNRLMIRSSQYAELQTALARADLPRDAYVRLGVSS